MHRFLRAAGFSMYQKKKDIRALLRCLAREAGTSSCLQLDRETELYEIKTEVAPGIGVAMYGELNEQDEMEIEYYYPYILNEEVTSRQNVPFSVIRRRKPMRGFWMSIR